MAKAKPRSQVLRGEMRDILRDIESAEDQCAALNVIETQQCRTPRKPNQKYTYPFWKVCVRCGKPMPCYSYAQAKNGQYCPDCLPKVLSGRRR